MAEVKKTYYAVGDSDNFKKGEIVRLTREEAKPFRNRRILISFPSAVRQGLYKKATDIVDYEKGEKPKTATPKKSLKKRRTKKQ